MKEKTDWERNPYFYTYVLLNCAETQTSWEAQSQSPQRSAYIFGFRALSHVSDSAGSGLCLWFLWHEHKLSASDYPVTRAGLGMCAWTSVCMRAPPLSSPDATPLCFCPAVWEVLRSTASHHLSGFGSSGWSCTCKIAQKYTFRWTQQQRKQQADDLGWLTCCRSH